MSALALKKACGNGIKNLNDLKRWDENDFVRKFGSSGKRLKALASGKDNRRVLPERSIKSISNETTLETMLARAAF